MIFYLLLKLILVTYFVLVKKHLMDCFGAGNEISKVDIKFFEEERHRQANSNPDSRTTSCVSLEYNVFIVIVFDS